MLGRAGYQLFRVEYLSNDAVPTLTKTLLIIMLILTINLDGRRAQGQVCLPVKFTGEVYRVC